MSKKKKLKGLTLFEIMIVIAIIVILVSFGSSAYSSAQNKQRIQKTKVYIHLLETALEEYFLDEGIYPEGNGDSESSAILYKALYGDINYDGTPENKTYLPQLNPQEKLVQKIRGKFLIKDDYGQVLYYRTGSKAINQTSFDIWSLGKNGKNEIDSSNKENDDISNFSLNE